MNRRVFLVGGLAAVAALGGGAWLATRPRGCGPELTADDLDQAVALGLRYLLSAQRADGAFVYEVDWRTGAVSSGDDPVRQAGATWGLGLANVDRPDPAAAAALDRALTFWSAAARSSDDGRVWLSPGTPRDATLGAVALIGLALVERLRAPIDPATRARYEPLLDGLLAFVKGTRMPGGGFHDRFDPQTGQPRGPGNPYADGESLLLLTKAGLYLDRPALVDLAAGWAEEDYDRNVVAPRAQTDDPDQTKGYYQWASMSWFELASAGREPDKLGGWLIELADWMVRVHGTLNRSRNTAYAYEGLLSAFAWARDHGDSATAESLACTAHQGLRKLFSWQLGHPLAAELGAPDPRFVGGVLNEVGDTKLRIDVTQHQTHAAMLARRFRLVG